MTRQILQRQHSQICADCVIKTAGLFSEPLSSPFPLRLLIGHTATLPTPHCLCFPEHNEVWQDETVPSGIIFMKLCQGKSKVYGCAHWTRTCFFFPSINFHTQQQQRALLQLYHMKNDFLLWQKLPPPSWLPPNPIYPSPNHSAASLSICICKSARPSQVEILEIGF